MSRKWNLKVSVSLGNWAGRFLQKKAQKLAFESAKRFHLSDFQTSIIGPRHSHFWSKTCNFLTKYRIYKFPFFLAYLTENLFRLFHHNVYFTCHCSDLSIQATRDSYETSSQVMRTIIRVLHMNIVKKFNFLKKF